MATTPSNDGLVLGALVASGETTRYRIGEVTGLSQATISRVVRRLVKAGMVTEGALVRGPDGGRATQMLEFHGGTELVCGIDMGGTNTRVVVVDQRARSVAVWRLPTALLSTDIMTADWLADAVLDGCGAVRERGLAATVVGVPGVVVPGTEEIQQVPNLEAVAGTGFARRLDQRLPGLVTLKNDSNVALIGEMCSGAALGLQDVAMVTVGTGVGAGVALQGELLTGARGLVGEFGSLPFDADGAIVEDVLSGAGLAVAGFGREAGHGTTSRAQVDAADDHRHGENRVVAATHALCVAMAVAYDLEMIVFGGRGSGQLGPVLAQVRERLATELPAAPQLVMSQLGDAAGALGAVAMSLQLVQQALGASTGPDYAHALGGVLRELAPVVVAALETSPASSTATTYADA